MSRARDVREAPLGSRTGLLGVLVAVALVLGAAVWVDVVPLLHPPPPEVEGKRLVPPSPQAVSTIEVVRGRKEFRLVREAGGWVLLDRGGRSVIRDDRVDEFLADLADLVELLSIGPAGRVPLGDFGLAEPRDRLALSWPDGRRILILLGDRNPPLTGIYALVLPEAEVVLVGAVLPLEIDKLAALASPPTSIKSANTR